jgi:O-antigen/teichoic acid export membrane protein
VQTQDVRAHEMAVALRNGLKMGGSLIITWSVALVVKVRVPAHLGPIRQGHFGFAESFATMFFAVLGLGIDTYIIKEVSVRPKHASDVVGGVFALRSLVTVLIFVVMGAVLHVSNRPRDIVLAVAVFGLINFVMAVNATLGAVLQAIAHVGAPVVANVVAKAVWGAGLLIGLHYNVQLAVLAMPGLAGELLRLAILLPAAGRAAGLRYRIDVPAVRTALLESVPYFVNSLALGVLSSLGMSVLEFIRVDEREVGWFAADQNAAYLCMLLSPMLFWVVMPLLARAHARSEAEGMEVFHRCLDALVITIVPLTVLISAGSDILIHLAFGPKYAPARLGLSILSLVFVLTYTNMMLAQNLIILRRGWSVTVISIAAVFVTSGLMLVFVPLGRHFVGEGGECAGAAASIIGSEMCVVVGMLSRFRSFPLDRRNILVLVKSVGLGAVVLVLDPHLRRLGPSRVIVDAMLYAGAAFAIGIVRPRDLEQVVRLFRLQVAERRAMSA